MVSRLGIGRDRARAFIRFLAPLQRVGDGRSPGVDDPARLLLEASVHPTDGVVHEAARMAKNKSKKSKKGLRRRVESIVDRVLARRGKKGKKGKK
jgi:hypothetical protein